MASRALNRNLQDAKKAKEDEFYTQLGDIERELRHYKAHFNDKVVYCNCDDPRVSNFFHYFSYNFEKLGLKKLLTTCYRSQQADLFSRNDAEHAIYLEYDGDEDGNNVPDPSEIEIKPLEGDGDFRSAEAIELLKRSDIVVTNPPFSMFREFVMQLIEYDKKFVIVGNQNDLLQGNLPAHSGRQDLARLQQRRHGVPRPRLLPASGDTVLGGRGRSEVAQPRQRLLVHEPRHLQAA